MHLTQHGYPEYHRLTDEMAITLNNDDKKWVANAISKAIKQQPLSLAVPPPVVTNPNPWPKWAENVRLWSAPAFLLSLSIFVLNEWSKYIEFRTHTIDTLQSIQESVRVLRAPKYPAEVLKEVAPLPPKEFSRSLEAIKIATDQQPREVSTVVMRQVSEKLGAVPQDTPDYWPTALRFIQFASATSSPDAAPVGPPNITVSNFYSIDLQVFGGKISSRVVLLDGGEMKNGTFEKCRIIFTKNPVGMKNVTFVNCVFEVPTLENPEPFLKRAGQLILASGVTNVSVPSL
jgi:hypothetical protein